MTSVIKVDTIQNTPGTNIINKCSTTITVGAACNSVAVTGNVVKSNALQASDAGNIISQSGTDITLGASGDTIALASGASQTGFGREGSVDWQTGSIKTAGFTPTNGEGYFCNTSGGAFAVTLPAGSAGNIVAFADYTRTFNSNNLTITPNGAEKIGGIDQDATLDINGQSATFVYVDSTEGWINVQETETSQTGLPPFIQATGGTPSQSGDYEIRTFTGPGTFCVTSLSPSAPENAVDWLVVAGGGSGGVGGDSPGGGGAGGYRESPGTATGSYTASPIAGGSAVTVSVQGYPITVGGAGAAISQGNTSTALCTTSTGGGKGSTTDAPEGPYAGGPGGSGGGGSGGNAPAAGTGNAPSTSPAQGFDGGVGRINTGDRAGGGGGGATVAGVAGASPKLGGDGGAGATTCITGSPVARAGGGGGNGQASDAGCGGAGGGGDAAGAPNAPGVGNNGTVNTGGGGGAGNGSAGNPALSGLGGSGVVILRYKFQ